jgi:hypothetical protein
VDRGPVNFLLRRWCRDVREGDVVMAKLRVSFGAAEIMTLEGS